MLKGGSQYEKVDYCPDNTVQTEARQPSFLQMLWTTSYIMPCSWLYCLERMRENQDAYPCLRCSLFHRNKRRNQATYDLVIRGPPLRSKIDHHDILRGQESRNLLPRLGWSLIAFWKVLRLYFLKKSLKSNNRHQGRGERGKGQHWKYGSTIFL